MYRSPRRSPSGWLRASASMNLTNCRSAERRNMIPSTFSRGHPSAQQISTISELFEASIISSCGTQDTNCASPKAEIHWGCGAFHAASICSKRLESSGSCDRMSALCLGFVIFVFLFGPRRTFFHSSLASLAKMHEDGLQSAPVGLHLGPHAEGPINGAQLAAPLVDHRLAWRRKVP